MIDIHDIVLLKALFGEGGGGTSNVQGLVLTMNPETYVVTAYLVDGEGQQVGQSQQIDIPLEATIIGASYDNTTKIITFTLTSGAYLQVPIGDIIYGLQPLIDAQHKLDASLVDDSTSTNKLCRFDSATGDLYVGGVRVLRVMDYDSYAALQTKDSIFYLTYPTPAQNSGRSLQTSPLTENENSDGEDIRTETEEPAPDESEMR